MPKRRGWARAPDSPVPGEGMDTRTARPTEDTPAAAADLDDALELELEVLLFSPLLRKGTRMSAFARYHLLKGRRIVRVRAANAATWIGNCGKPGD
jgi:hypothetical protein